MQPTLYPATWSILLITIATSILGGFFFRQYGAPFGAEIPWRMVGGGEWWRLLTCMFVHHGFGHAFANLFLLWIFGQRLERIVGAGPFVGLYLLSGVFGNVVSLAVDPERISYGASGAVFAVASALIGIYSVRLSRLSNQQKWRLGFLVFFTIGTISAGFFDDHVDNPSHVTGFLAGLVLGILFASRVGQAPSQRVRIFAGMGVLLLSGCIWIRLTHSYLVHVHAAERAVDLKQYDDAARELDLAVAMKPGSRLAHDLTFRLQAERRPPVNYCATLASDPIQVARFVDPCDGKQCDGQLHPYSFWNPTQAYYVGTVTTTAPLEEGRRERETTATVTMQALDEFGEIGCTVKWSRISRQKVDAKGNAIGMLVVTSDSRATISASDPQAVALHKLILARKQFTQPAVD